jgi:signal transduction histidine kinase
MRPWPRSLAGRTALVLVSALTVVQVAGLTIHAFDRIGLLRLAQTRDVAMRIADIYRAVALISPERREAIVRDLDLRDGATARLEAGPPTEDLPQTPQPQRRQIAVSLGLVPVPQVHRWREMVMLGGTAEQRLVVGMHMPQGRWLNMSVPMPPPRFWYSSSFLAAFLLMNMTAGLLTLWAVRRLTDPVRTLGRAAEALGRDVNAPPLPEDGPTEVATAAAAFNLMAARIRRFVQDRTFMLTAIGHDLRTPITRLKLRVEFMEDDEMRRKMLADLDELEAMVAATLAFGRDITTDEPVTAVDLAELLRTILDEASDTNPDKASAIAYAGPDHLPVRGRPVALKRALVNLVMNALNYGAAARVTLRLPHQGTVTLLVEDEGPGIPLAELDRVFQPFHRVEPSRNNETGGMGLGLPITRNILRAHGGDVSLSNRPTGGARATVTLPV